MLSTILRASSLVLLVLVAGAWAAAGVQDEDSLPSLASVLERLNALEPEVEGVTDPVGARRALLLELRETLTLLGQDQADAEVSRQEQAEAPGLLKDLTARLAEPQEVPEIEPGPTTTAADLEARAAQARADAAAAERSVEELKAESEIRKLRVPALREEIAQARQLVAELEVREAAAEPVDPAKELSSLQYELRLARLARARAHLAALEAERDSYEERKALLPLRKDAAKRSVDQSNAKAQALDQAAAILQRREAERALAEATSRTVQSLGELQPLAREIEELANMEAGEGGLLEREEQVDGYLAIVEADQAELERRLKNTQVRIIRAGRSEGMGAILRREFEALPGLNDETPSLRRIRQDLSDVQLLELEFTARREAAGGVARELQRLEAALQDEIALDPELPGVIREMLETRRRQLTDLEIQAVELGFKLSNLRTNLLERQKWVDAYRSYIRERILWVRSATGGLLPEQEEFAKGLAWMADGQQWARARSGFFSSESASLRATWYAVLLACLLVWGIGRTARSQLEEAAEAVRSYKTDSFHHTVRALLASVLLATRFPSILLVFGLGLKWFAPDVDQAQAVASGLIAASLVMYLMRFVRALVLPKGLGQIHFRWPARTTEFLASRVRHFTIPFAVCVAVVVTLDHSEVVRSTQFGRALFCVAMGMLATLLYRVLNPTGPVIAEYKKRRPGWLFRSAAPAVQRLAVAIPILLALAALAGYYYTALRLAERLALSIAFGVVLVLLYGLMLRWLFLARRQLAIEQARQRALAKAEAAKAEGDENYMPAPIDESTLDLPAVNAQTQQLFRFAIACLALVVGLGIWSSTLPALKIFNRVQIWPSFELVSEKQSSDPISEMLGQGSAEDLASEGGLGGVESEPVAGAQGLPMSPSPLVPMAGATAANQEPAPGEAIPNRVTLGDLGMAILILVLTMGAARNLPSFVEIVLLQRLELDAGSRNAISTLVRYVILILGIVLGFGAVGLSWGSIQWLAAALTFGLAFGLQEIFANFVSGLIILIERPVRVGDIVTVAGMEGKVTRLRMRATTILDYDRREMLVPNREFITGSLINWTLSDPITRIIIPVGVAYGSDVELTRTLLLRAAKESGLVVDDPPAQSIFRAFGASSLDFELRCHMANREMWARVVDDVHRRIDALFREAEIEISFPQQDLHIRSIGPLGEALGAVPKEQAMDGPLDGRDGEPEGAGLPGA